MIHIDGAALSGGDLGIADKPRWCADRSERSVPRIAIGRLAGNNRNPALGQDLGDHVPLVRHERLHHLDGAIGQRDRFRVRARAADRGALGG